MSPHAFFVGNDGRLEWRDAGPLTPAACEVLIAVEAAGVNRPDLLQRAGLYPPPEGASQALGLEVAGIVEAIGEQVTRFAPGDRVMALVPGGGYASHCLADEGTVMAMPDAFTFVEAAAFPETAFTVWTNAFEAGRLAKGERLFVHGATSGIGTMAASIATAHGIEVFGTAGSTGKVAAGERAGFTKVWNYKEEDWSTAMSALGGCDVVLDMVGGDYVPRNLAMLKAGGRHVSIAFLGGIEAKVGIMDIMRRQLTLTGSTLRARSKEEKARLRAVVEGALFPLIEIGKIKPLVTLELPMREADRAHQAMQSGELVGKAVLVKDESLQP
ncbi:NAD(P)H-quinone oxidoreductase [Parvularcula lutaonensis]|uniref:NAD(P)H-quinone oxidoreductase n=1 Tax=Parvularcula lutaonensis TaxID=491923 RepID=A0ABV7MEY7_9PROT|nr:NAD(P)H-quinone oxidoreductase [Parvularcula lutaonensis]GGY54560.1 NAD(P)H quinone oxidoreductase [Parvularcula lutaonensis]